MPANLEASIEISASPTRVWGVVSDLARMPEWSPQVRKTIVRGGPTGVGTRTINLNRRGLSVWVMRGRVVSYEPNKRIAWQIIDNRAIWAFDLEPLDDNTRTKLVQTRDLSNGTTKISRALTKAFLGGQESFDSELAAGMRLTLERIRLTVESHS